METKQAQGEREWLTSAEAGKLIGVHPQTIRDWEREGKISAKRTPGGHRRFHRDAVQAVMTSALADEAPGAAS